MSRRLLAMAAFVSLIAVSVAACGGPPDPPAGGGGSGPNRTPVASSSPTPTPTAEPTPAFTPGPMPTRTPRPSPTPTPTPPVSPVAQAFALAAATADGFEISVELWVFRVGLSAIELSAVAHGPDVELVGIWAGDVLGLNPVVGVDELDVDAGLAKLAFARRGPSAPGAAEGEVAVIGVRAEDRVSLSDGLSVELSWTDAGLRRRAPLAIALTD